MKKERIKSIVLIALVISSLVLTGQIWFNEKLWPEGYNFFVDIKASASLHLSELFGVEPKEEVTVRTSIASPIYLAAYMVKDFDHAITVLNTTSDDYGVINDYVSSVISHAMSRDIKNVIKVSEDDWRKALFTRGFYVDYGVEYKTHTFAQIFGGYTPSFSDTISSLRRFIITADDSLVSDVSVYVADESNNEFYKISTGLDKGEFNTNLSMLAPDATPKKRFSFFINADVPTGVAGEAVFAPYLILNEDSTQRKTIFASNPVLDEDGVGLSMYTIERILKAFSINPKTAVKYTDADGSIMFVQSKNTIKISPDGVLSYTTVEGGKGLVLKKGASTHDAALTLSAAVGLVGEVYSALINNDARLYLNGLEENQNTLKASFGYMYDGVPIVFGGKYSGENAVEIECKDGYLKSYRQVIRHYDDSGNMALTEPTYDAKIFDVLSEEEKISGIEKLFEAYDDDGNDGEKFSSWFVKIKGIDGYRR